ncbi:MAG: glycoside hydrolase family 88 protein [Firmicutes bacterium]|nr:glycoside hydrolase family 88 protein [Bacillota bacterium]
MYGKVNYNRAKYNANNPGCSRCVRARGQAWYAMALIDTIELMEKGENRDILIFIYKELMDSLIKYQDDNGMWRQVIKHDAVYAGAE